MSQMTARSAVFLEEMGVGAQWKLRHQSMDVEQMEEAEVRQAEQPEPLVVHAAPVHAPVPAHAAVHAAVPAPVEAAAEAPPVRTAPPMPVAEPVQAAWPATTVEESIANANTASLNAAAADDSNAWFDEAPTPARLAPVSDEAIAVMDWPALKTAVSTCTRCDLCATRRNAVNGRGAADASWIAIAAAPSRLDEKDVQPFAGEAGQLLDNMLKAISLKPGADVYVTNLVKCRPAGPDGADRAPTIEELTACRPFLHRELALTGATMAMTFGQYAAKGLMMGPAARGKVMRYGAAELPVVATYHPDDLLRKPEDKAKAWADLCLARTARD
jgi:uracil-DNA glycosylase family 4